MSRPTAHLRIFLCGALVPVTCIFSSIQSCPGSLCGTFLTSCLIPVVSRSTSHLRVFLCGALVPVAPLFTMAIPAHFGVAVCRCMWVGGWDYHIM
ncbi:hypothetical protein C8J57DRAFT_467752 [Mycena rebaudengoi]|nr:hypothetical protein C8J57DRAFT_467752 [Mycena rebaudengoi]